MTRSVRIGRLAAAGASVACLASLAGGCSAAATASNSNSYLMVNTLEAASGATPSDFSGTLASDVQTLVSETVGGQQVRVPTVFADNGEVTFGLGLKDPGTSDAPTAPTTANDVTITRYHVDYVRSDGRNTQGVDVPYSFDGAFTLTVTATAQTATFTLVRSQAKQEAPLVALVNGGGAGTISTIANITFYGTDQTGRAVSVVASISVNFADWGDPQ